MPAKPSPRLTWFSPLLLAWVLGNALQLQQAQLGTDLDYLWPVLGCCLFAGLVHMGWRFASWPQTLGPCLAYLGFASVLLSVGVWISGVKRPAMAYNAA